MLGETRQEDGGGAGLGSEVKSVKSRTQEISVDNPEKRAKEALTQAQEYEKKIKNRVQFLAKEEQKYMRKISQSRQAAEKIHTIKTDKISFLQKRIDIERHQQEQMQKKIEDGRALRDIAQANKLKKAYENMVKFEAQRKVDKEEKEERKQNVYKQKQNILARNYQDAEKLRD